MAAGDLTTLPNALAWLGMSADDANGTVARLVTAVSTQIQTFLGYQIAEATYTRSLESPGGFSLVLPDRPVVSLTSLQVGTTVVPAASGLSWGWWLSGNAIKLQGFRFPPCGLGGLVLVSYVAGYTSTPADIEQACFEWMSGIYQSQARDPAVTRQRAGDTEQYFASPDIKSASVGLIPPGIAAVLQPYRRMW